MRIQSIAVAASVVLSTLAVSSTSAAEGPRGNKAKKPVAVAVAELPPLPAPEPPPAAPAAPAAPPAADKPADAPKAEVSQQAGPGFVLTVGSGVAYLGGNAAQSVAVSGAQVTFDIRLGGYLTNRFGILAGAQGGYGALFEGCSSVCSNAYSYQLPVVAQYALRDRRRGVYFEGGLAFLSTYGASTGKDEKSPETLELASSFDFKLGIGYRIAGQPEPSTRKDVATGMDIRLGLDVGEFKRLEYRSVGGDVAGDIAPSKADTHFALGLAVGYHFTP